MNPDEAFKIHVQQNCHDNQSNQNHCEESTVSRSAATNASDCGRDAAHGDGHAQQESQTFIAEQVFRTVCAFLGFFTNVNLLFVSQHFQYECCWQVIINKFSSYLSTFQLLHV